MELGMRLRQARQEAGMTQRQLCGDRITRNMLSQIENGTARPSMDTLCYLAGQLGKPVSFFLAEQPTKSREDLRMAQLRIASPRQVLALLADDWQPDEAHDAERFLIEALACIALAEEATKQGKLPYAADLLERAKQAGDHTPYYTRELERWRLLLCARTGADVCQLAQQLPPLEEELLLRARSALVQKDAARCGQLLEAAQVRDAGWHFLMGQALLLQKQYRKAAEQLQQAETYAPARVYALLEQCYQALEDYKQAYFYACRLRETEKTGTSLFENRDV